VQLVGKARFPEAITAGMARISRDPTPVPQLIREARQNTALARERNQRVVYEYGHNSVAEHGCFSVAIWDIPRLLSLQIVSHRLAAYTQHSGRYIPFEQVERQFFLPREYRRGKARRLVEEGVEESYRCYEEIFRGCVAYLREKYPRMTEEAAKRRATEDARYVWPLAQTTQVGLTTNAREFALIITRLLSHSLSEFRETGEKLFAVLHPLAPSLFPEKYIRALEYPCSGIAAVQETAHSLGLMPAQGNGEALRPVSQESVRLVRYDSDGERHLATALLFHAVQMPLVQAQAAAQRLSSEQIGALIRSAYTGLHAHDTVLREFELVQYQFEVILSEAAYHQLIRHRMKTDIRQAHSPAHGRTLPPLVRNAGFADLYQRGLELLERTYAALGADERAQIMLGNGHNLRVLIGLNARELVEMSRIRSDRHAQWDIRNVVNAMVEAVAQVHPHIALACGGRDVFKSGEHPLVAVGGLPSNPTAG